jgi:ELWxxDGT repeat protein
MFAFRSSVASIAATALLLLLAGSASASDATLVRDIRPVGGADPQWLVQAGEEVFFSANDGSHGRELWASDGTAAGTKLVKDIRPGAAGSRPDTLTQVGSRVYFTADDGRHGRELWVSDGTAAGTHLVKDLTPGSKGTWTLGIISVGDTAYFDVVYDGLYRTDGSAQGTRKVHGFSAVGLGAAVAKGARLYFPAAVTLAGTGGVASASPGGTMNLWKTDGTTTGTKRLGPKDLSVTDLVKQAGRIYFLGSPRSPLGLDVPDRVWRSDGTRAGTRRLSTVYVASDTAAALVRMGGALWFNGSTSPYLESARLYRSAGTAAGTGPVRPRVGQLRDMVSVVGRLWAHRHSPRVHDPDELWVSDGTAAGTSLVYGGTGDWFVGDWGELACEGLDGRIWFAAGPGDATDGPVDNELWSSDGTSEGTVEAADINPTGSSEPRNLLRLGDTILFTATDGQHGRELWRLSP